MGSSSKTTTSTTEGGGTSTTTSSPLQQPYYKQLIGQANNLYQQGLPNYYGGATVAGMTPAQMESMNQSANWATQGAQDMMGSVNQNFGQMMSGKATMAQGYGGLTDQFNGGLGQMMSGQVQTGEGTPWQGLADSYTQMAGEEAAKLNTQVRGGQVMSGQHGGSSRGDLLNNQVMDAANDQVSNNLAAMYGNAYGQAQQQQSDAIGQYGRASLNAQNNAAQTQMGALQQYGSIMSMPMQIAQGLYNQVGLPQQQMNQAIMNDAKQRYDYAAMKPWNNAAQFGNFLQGNMGGTNTVGSSSHSTTTQR